MFPQFKKRGIIVSLKHVYLLPYVIILAVQVLIHNELRLKKNARRNPMSLS